MPDYDIKASPEQLIIYGPIPLQHEGRLRNPKYDIANFKTTTRKHGTNYSRRRQVMKPCGHFAMYAWRVSDGTGWYLGISFNNDAKGQLTFYRCYYPNTKSPDENNPYFHAIINAESGSYWVWDNLIDKPLGVGYIQF